VILDEDEEGYAGGGAAVRAPDASDDRVVPPAPISGKGTSVEDGCRGV